MKAMKSPQNLYPADNDFQRILEASEYPSIVYICLSQFGDIPI